MSRETDPAGTGRQDRRKIGLAAMGRESGSAAARAWAVGAAGWVAAVVFVGCGSGRNTADLVPADDGAYHVYPGQEIQEALDAAAADAEHKWVVVHPGVYAPSKRSAALIRLVARHDGIVLEAKGETILTATNGDLADPSRAGNGALVAHVVYFGDGISRRTVLRGFRITGADGYQSNAEEARRLEPRLGQPGLEDGMFLHTDGGGIKVFGRSSPTIQNVELYDNAAALCGGAISIEQRGLATEDVLLQDCIFRANRCPGTGSAVDVLQGSSAIIENCLFVGNIGNTGMDDVAHDYGLVYNPEHGCGALTVFPGSRVSVRRCTFTGNWNGADDQGTHSVYADTIFWMNDAGDGSRPGGPYELDVTHRAEVRNCFLGGAIDDLRGAVNRQNNVLGAPDPEFDEQFRPQAAVYGNVGYRPPDGRQTAEP